MMDQTHNNSLKSIYEEYADTLYSYGCKFTRDKELVKDCIHDIFVYLHSIDSQSVRNIKFYLLQALKNNLITKLSKIGETTYPENLEFTIPNPDTIETIFLQEEESQRVKNLLQTALNTLTNRQKEAIYLYYIEELEYAEICRLLDMNYQSVRNLIHRALSNLRKTMNEKDLMLVYFLIHLSLIYQ